MLNRDRDPAFMRELQRLHEEAEQRATREQEAAQQQAAREQAARQREEEMRRNLQELQ